MKTILNTFLAIGLTGLFLIPGNLKAQDHPCVKPQQNLLIRYQADPVDFPDAYKFWQRMLKACDNKVEECPCLAKANMWDVGIYVLDGLTREYQNSKDPKFQTVRDSLVLAYRQKMEKFGRTPADLKDLGFALATYDDFGAKRKEIFQLLNESIELAGNENANPAAIQYSFMAAYTMLASKDEGADCAWLADIYFQYSGILENHIKNDNESEICGGVQAELDKYVESCLSCDELIPMAEQKTETLPESEEEAKAIVLKYLDLLDSKGCQDSDVFKRLAVKAYEFDKTSSAAYNLGVMYLSEGKNSKALEYFKEAMELEGEGSNRGKYIMTVARTYNKMGNLKTAAEYGRKAAPYDKEGWKYVAEYIISNQTCGSTGIERKSVYWLASDYMQKAGYGEDFYKTKYPSVNELFDKAMEIGQSYTVSCFGEKTTVRAKDK